MKKVIKDTSWPPLGVQDLRPDIPVKKETIKFSTLKQAFIKSNKK